jgi:hypothetical protein
MSLELLPDALLFKLLDMVPLSSVKNVQFANKNFSSILKNFVHDRSLTCIQRFCRWYSSFASTKHLIVRFHAANLTGIRMQAIGFDAAVVQLRKKATIFHAKLLLKRILNVSFVLCPELRMMVSGNHNIRIFLAAFLIVYFPEHVFERLGAVEQAVIFEGRALLACVEAFVVHFASNFSFKRLPRENCSALLVQLQLYEQAFQAWKQPDELRLVARIEIALCGLYYAAREIPPHDDRLRREFNTQIQRLRAKLVQLSGSAGLDRFDDELMDTMTLELYEALNPIDWETRANELMSGL